MTAFIKLLFLTLATWVVVVAAINYSLDPAGLFAHEGKEERQIAGAMVEGKNVLIKVNRNPRLILRLRIEQDTSHPSALVLGSSRSLPVSSESLNEPLINCSISSACFEDLVTFGVMAKDKFHPAQILLSIDPWIFNAHGFHQIPMDGDTVRSYLQSSRKIGFQPDRLNQSGAVRYKQLLNLDYTIDSLKLLLKSALTEPNFRVTSSNESLENYDLIRADGSRMIHQRLLRQSPNEVAANAHVRMIFPCTDYQYSQEGARALRLLIDYLKQNCQLKIVLFPLHPATYPLLCQGYPVKDSEAEIRAMAEAEGLTVLGSFDPAKVGCSEADFYDPIHCNSSGVRKTLAQW